MKTSILKYIPFFIFIAFLTNCTVKDITVDPATGEKKSLIMISPDYLKTTIQVRLRDADTKAFLKNEMVVKVYSNKKVIDFGGHYKNEFTVKNGILNFAIDPNEDISTASPLSLRVESSVPGKLNANSTYLPNMYNLILTSPNSKVILLEHNKFVASASQAFSGIKPLSFSSIPTYLTINDSIIKISDRTFYYDKIFSNPDLYIESYFEGPYFNIKYNVKNLRFKINYMPGINKFLNDYSVLFNYESKNNLDNQLIQSSVYTVFKSGKTILNDEYNKITESKIQPFNGDIILPNLESLTYFKIKVYTNDIGTCPAGYSFSFSGLGNNGTQLEYTRSRTNVNGEKYITGMGIVKINGMVSATPSDATERDILFGKLANSISFLPNSQYSVEPQTMDLGDSSSCGKTFNFKLTPNVNLTKYKIILKAGCSGKNISITPNLSALFKGSLLDDLHLEGVEFIAGSTTLYLTPKGDYNFQGEYNGKNFNFNLSTDFSNLANMRLTTLASNPDLKDLMYSNMMTVNGVKLITVNLTFKESSCPF